MASPILYGVNRLETGTVTTTGAAADSPKERLFDRDITLPWVDSSNAGTRTIQVDQGASTILALDTWIIAAGHNLSGATVNLDSSPDGAAWTNRDTFVPASSALSRRSISTQTIRFWRVTITGAAAAPSIAELFLTVALTVQASGGPEANSATYSEVANIERHESRAGYVWIAARGATRWSVAYTLINLTTAERDALITLFATVQGAKLLYLLDEESAVYWAEWQNSALAFRHVATAAGARWSTALSFREAL